MTNRTYDLIKDISLLWLPAGTTLLGVIWAAWGLPYAEPILTTITGIDAFLGAVVKYFKSRYDRDTIQEGNAGNDERTGN